MMSYLASFATNRKLQCKLSSSLFHICIPFFISAATTVNTYVYFPEIRPYKISAIIPKKQKNCSKKERKIYGKCNFI